MKNKFKLTRTPKAFILCAITGFSWPVFAHEEGRLTQLIEQGIHLDASRQEYSASASAMREMGVASGQLMDPKIKVGVGALPMNSYKLNQDPMTTVSVGLMQQFERGSTRALKEIKANQEADGMEYQIIAREWSLANTMTQLWLELGYLQKAEKILIENQDLMRDLAVFIQSNYAIGKNEVQDLLNAQMQISQFDEKRQANKQMQGRILSQFSQWLGRDWLKRQPALKASNHLPWKRLTEKLKKSQGTDHFSLLNQNPLVQMAQSQIQVNETQVDIAEQAYKPQFGVEVMYAHRQANGMNGESAPDLLSAYLTLDIPLFTQKKQDKVFAASQYQVGAMTSQKAVLLEQMNSEVNTLLVDKINLEQRIERYKTSLIEQAKARTDAVERGYENNRAQFNDVILAMRDELALQLEQERLLTDLNIVKSKLALLLNGFEFKRTNPLISPPKGRS